MKNDFDEIWERIKSETNLISFKDLGEIIKRTGPAVSGAKAKNEFPPGWAYLVGKQFGLLTEWIMTGEGPKRLNDREGMNPFLVEVNEWLKEEVRRNPKQEIWFEVQFEKKFQEFKKWKEEKEESEARESSTSTRKVA